MPASVLLVHDDIALIAAVRRLLINEGCEVTLATSAADAVIVYGDMKPGLVVLCPSVEGGRGKAALDGLSQHPDWGSSGLLLLGEGVPGYDAPVLSLPLDGSIFMESVRSALKVAEAPSDLPPTASRQPPPPESTEGDELIKLRAAVPRAEKAARLEPERPAAARIDPERPAPRIEPERPAEPAAASAHLPGTGVVSLEQLGKMVWTLASTPGPLCLELRAPRGLRTLWLQQGRLLAATSSVEQESILDRARRDGLIDGKQESEIWLSGATSPVEILRALLAKGFLRQAEVSPLVQRYVDEVGRTAFNESDTSYRLSDRPIPRGISSAREPAPALQVLAEAVRYGRGSEFMLNALGGRNAIPSAARAPQSEEMPALSTQQVALIRRADGRESIESLCALVGIPLDIGVGAFWVGNILGLVEFQSAPQELAAMIEIDVRRLDAKFEAVQQADYFQMLGLPRSAGVEEVREAFEVLSAQYNPLKFAGHADPRVHQRAQQVRELLAEAATALEDDDLRSQYARSLAD
jgi:CheY-like chemotaxis protein